MTHKQLRNNPFPGRQDTITLARLSNQAISRNVISHPDGKMDWDTKRQQKHEMLIAFMANIKNPKQTRRPAPVKTKLLKTLLSFFF